MSQSQNDKHKCNHSDCVENNTKAYRVGYEWEKSLIVHKQRKHKRITRAVRKSRTCVPCGLLFSSPDALRIHISE